MRHLTTLLLCTALLSESHFNHLFAQVNPDQFAMLQYRCIGPHRGGRTVGAVGVPQQPGVFYIGVNNGGVWKTDDYGRTWIPIFDDQPTGSVGDVAVAPSDPNVLYVASGEGIQRPDLSVGNGVYKSADGGKTWANTGLQDGQQIGGLAIDPTNPNIVFAAVLGHPYGPNAERGLFRTKNGGKTWEKVKYINENTGAIQVTIDPSNPKIIYADFFETRLYPWENGRAWGQNSGLWKSTDGGDTWKQLTKGLPTPAEGLGRIGFCISQSNPSRLYATVDCGEGSAFEQNGGIFRSDDAGETWYRTHADPRLWGRGDDFAEIKCDPKNPDVVYSANVVTWKSTDGGKSWLAWRGAPGGDDYHRMWINPNDPNIILIASDQGAIITVNGGRSFSSWYNQPTAQFYHVSTDNAFPYNVYGGQQESGSVCISSRGTDGQITFHDWHPVGVEEYGYVAADPLDPNIIYGGKITRHDKRTGQTQNVAPEAVRSGKYRFIRTAPVLFSPIDPHTLFFAGNVLFKTRNGGHSWEVISPDLTRETWQIPQNVGIYAEKATKTDQRRRGVIYTVAPSPLDSNLIWCGTDDGLMHVTRDGGKNWENITPPGIPAWAKISLMEASHFDKNVAYAAVNAIRLDDQRAHVWRTRDGGKTWQETTTGLPDEPLNAVREDPKTPGLLFVGSERSVHVSFDDGTHWQSLRLNMPATSIRDLVIKDDDLVLGTHGRSFWILDNFSALRALKDAAFRQKNTPILHKPAVAYRVRWNNYTDTPLPQEEPAGQNPPDGAILDYYLPEDARDIRLDILDNQGKIIRTYQTNDVAPDVSRVNIPLYWIRPFQLLSGKKGAHRFCWDMRHTPLPTGASFPIAAVYGQTAPDPTGVLAMPGTYTARLTVNGQNYEQPLDLKMDPRVQTAPKALQQQFDLSTACVKAVTDLSEKMKTIAAVQQQLQATTEAKLKSASAQWTELAAQNSALQGQARRLFEVLQDSDMPPTQQAIATADSLASRVAKHSERLSNLSAAYNAAKTSLKSNKKANKKAPEIPIPLPAPDAFTRKHPDAAILATAFQPLYRNDLSDMQVPKDVWSINAAGELTATEDQSIWSKEKYTDFVLDLEFKTAPGTNSGVILHCSDTDNWIPNSMEVQIADDYAEQWATANPTWQCAAIFGYVPAQTRRVKPPGEWNRYTITSIKREVFVVLNGELVNHIDLSRWLSGSKNPDGTAPPSWLWKPLAVLPLEGYIGLQGKHAGAPIWFRNVRIRKM